MNFFNIEGKNYEEAKKALEENRKALETDFANGGMKAGRYLGILYIMEAAERGDITSQVALGNLYEMGSIVDQDTEEAVRWYRAALAQDHPKRDGTMLADGAAKGLERLGRR